MRRRVWLLGVYVVILLVGFSLTSDSVTVKDKGNAVSIKTDMLELNWKKTADMGYDSAVPTGAKVSLLKSADRVFYHASDYRGGWKQWGKLDKFKILEETPNKVVVEYTSFDGDSFEYSCIATYWDGVPFFKHEVRVTNKGPENTAWPVSGYDPMVNPGVPFGEKRAKAKLWKTPIPHGAYWVDEGYFGALYSTHPDAKAKFGDWQGNFDWLQLDHDSQIALIEKKKQSEPILYFVAFAKGGEVEAHALADSIIKAKEVDPQAVDFSGKLPITWGKMKFSK